VRILFDQGTPVPLRTFLAPHKVETVFELGWHLLKNGELISAAEAAGFDVFVTTDQHLKNQQNLGKRRLSVVVLLTTDWGLIQGSASRVAAVIGSSAPDGYVEVPFPKRST
jgi:hypothetical protein